jgi:hypothetical protein
MHTPQPMSPPPAGPSQQAMWSPQQATEEGQWKHVAETP